MDRGVCTWIHESLLWKSAGDPDTWRIPVLTLPHLAFNIAKTPDMGGYFIFVPGSGVLFLVWFMDQQIEKPVYPILVDSAEI